MQSLGSQRRADNDQSPPLDLFVAVTGEARTWKLYIVEL